MTLKQGMTSLSAFLLLSMSMCVLWLCEEATGIQLAALLALAALGVQGATCLMFSAIQTRKRSSSDLSVEYESRDDMLAEDLVHAMRFTDGESYERAITTLILRVVCRQDGNQPSSIDELLERLDSFNLIRNPINASILEGITLDEIHKVRVRCLALGRLDQIIGR